MKITNVRAVQPVAEKSPPDWRTTLGQILVAVDTDVGITGYGVGGGGLAGIHVIKTVLRDFLQDRDPEDVESLWELMYQTTLPYGQKGLAIMALSGIDLALWDIRGKAAKLPLAELLGGKVGQPMPTYITVWDTIHAALDRGFRSFKLHVENRDDGDKVAAVASTVEEARREVGDECDIAIDAWMRWDLPTTIDVARAIEPFRVTWIEEPLPADDLDGYAILATESPVPIAGGEHEFTAAAFRPLVERRLHTILQPDVCWCGGLTQLIEIYKMAQGAGLRVCPHRGSEVWSLHAIAALDNDPLPESGRPWMTWVGGQPPIEDGYVTLTDRIGFGVEIDEDSLEILYS
ncbi:MAG: hypothetical protein CMJ78_05460 [Planctomycetaceae bacterium]|nr:hypothetical protein [Planctomycetaceae bacterium]